MLLLCPGLPGTLFVNPDTGQAVRLDHRICDTRYPFAYTLYTREQDALMHKYRGAAGDAPQSAGQRLFDSMSW